MASLTLKNIPESLLESLRQRARRNRRSLLQEAVLLLESALSMRAAESASPYGAGGAGTIDDEQVAVWQDLCGKWQSDTHGDDEVAEIYQSRRAGREVDL